MKCREARELLVALSNDEVTRSERLLTQAHLAGCPACRAEFESLAEVRRRLTVGLKARAAAAAPSPRAWTAIQGRLGPGSRVAQTRRWLIPASRLVSGALMAVVLFAASSALNPLTRARLVSEAATATPERATALPTVTATPVIVLEPGADLTAQEAGDSRREMAIDRAAALGRNRPPLAVPARPARRDADRFDVDDTMVELDSAPAIEETETPCNACNLLN
ncbi:MAG: zf-HC2 domain-containing protein [Thermoflexales bacterium]